MNPMLYRIVTGSQLLKCELKGLLTLLHGTYERMEVDFQVCTVGCAIWQLWETVDKSVLLLVFQLYCAKV